MNSLKRTLALSAMALLCGGVMADDAKPAPKSMDDWTFFQLGFAPGAPGATDYSNVYGLKLGAPMVSGYGRVNGLEPSILYSGTNYVKGIQATILGACLSRDVEGVQAAWFGVSHSREIWGVQGAIGACVADTVEGFQGSLANVANKPSDGCQAAVANVATKFNGFQTGAVNVAREELNGFQFGAVNYSSHNGLQIGLVNIIKDGPLPFMILINFSFKDDAAAKPEPAKAAVN